MSALEQIAEINAQFRERVRLLEVERDAKIALIRRDCEHVFPLSLWVHECINCGEPKRNHVSLPKLTPDQIACLDENTMTKAFGSAR